MTPTNPPQYSIEDLGDSKSLLIASKSDVIKSLPVSPSKRLAPSDNKFHKGAKDGKHYWLTPQDLYQTLDDEFHFDFDPAPYPLPDGFDGLTAEWGTSSYLNPPFGSIMHEGKRKGATAWARKAIAENKKGKRVVMVYPIDKWVLMLLEAGAKVRNLKDVRWLATEDGSQGKGTGRHIACFILEADDPVSDLVVKSVADSTDVANPPKLNQLIYTQVLELIGEDEKNGRKYNPVRNALREELRAKAKAKFIGDSE